MSITGHRGPLPLLNVSEEEAWQWRQHRLVTAKAYEVVLGCPAPFEDLGSIDHAFEQVSGVERLTLRAAGVLRRVFTPPGSGEINGVAAIPIGPLHQKVAIRFATRYGIGELTQCYAEMVRLLVSAPGRLSGRRYRAAEVRFLGTVSDYASRYKRYLMLGLHDEFPGPARPPVRFEPWAFPYLDISLNLDTVVASQLSEVLEALDQGVVSLTEVTTVWPDWLRLAKAFSDSYQLDPARALGAIGSLGDPEQLDAAALGPLEREYLATLCLLLDMYRQNREEGSQEVFSFRNDGEGGELEHLVWGWGAGGDYSLADAEADPANRGLGGLRGQGGISELRQVGRMAAWGFVDQAGIEERWPEFFVLADELAGEEGRWDLQDAHAHLGAEPVTRVAYLTGLLQLIDTTRTRARRDRGR
ncbi:MAG: hypothetical protein ACYCZN_12185 [Candidatus Dormibacteria bacterium]